MPGNERNRNLSDNGGWSTLARTIIEMAAPGFVVFEAWAFPLSGSMGFSCGTYLPINGRLACFELPTELRNGSAHGFGTGTKEP